MDRLFNVASASVTRRIFTNMTKGDKCHLFWRQASKYLRFLSHSALTRLFFRILFTYNTASVLAILMSRMQSVPHAPKSLIRRSPLCSKSTFVPSGLLGCWYLSRGALSLRTAQSEMMREFSRTCVCMRVLLARSATPSHSSLL